MNQNHSTNRDQPQNVPVGYKQTEVGLIPDSWVCKPLFEFVSYTNGKAHENCITDCGKFTVVNSKFISTEGQVCKYSNQSLCEATIGDVLMVMSDVPNGRAIAKCFLVSHNDTYTVNQRICILRPKNIDGRLLFYKLNRNPFYLSFDDGVKQTNLRKSDVLSCHLGIPNSQTEQQSIATALSDADAYIESLEKLIAKKRAIKKGVMQELLTGKRRLPGFSGEWGETTLGEIGNFKNGLNKNSDAFGHGSPFVNLMDVFGVNAINSTSHLGLVASTKLDQEVYDLRQGDVLFIRSSVKPSGVGLTAVVECDLPKTVYSGFLIRFRDDGILDDGFKKHCFYAEDFRKKVIAASSVSANTNINQNALQALTLLLPPTKEEQIAIANVLNDIDTDITAHEAKLSKARLIKQGMMQELLTGRIRLI